MAAMDPRERAHFLNLAGLFQGSLVFAALGLAWLVDLDPWDAVHWNVSVLGWSALATLPLCGLSWWISRSTWPACARMRGIWEETLGPVLAQCRALDLVLLALFIGISEELLFRGVLQPWLGRRGFWFGVIASNVVFGLVHALTPTYALLAGLIGVYLALTMELADPPNLLIPVLCHAGCDLFSFLLIRRGRRARS